MSSTTRIPTSRLVDTIGVLAVVTGLVLGLVPGIAIAGHGDQYGDTDGDGDVDGDDVQFAIDGDATGVHDFGTASARDEIQNNPSEQDTTWFQSGMRESNYPSWSFQNSGNKEQADLEHLYVKSQVSEAGTFVWLGATRQKGNGNAQVAVEFNKLLPPSEPTAHYRSEGDLYVVFNFPGTGGGGSDNVQVAISQWPAGTTTGSYGAAAGLTTPSHYRYAMSQDRTFIEVELDLAEIFTDGLGIECSSFGGVSFRTEASSGTGDTDGDTTGGNENSTLKDITHPIPIDLDTCAEVTVEKVDDDDQPLNGAQFRVYAGHGADAAGTPEATCTTGPDATDLDGANTEADGECSFGALQPGNYTLHETGVPDGYRISPDIGAEGYDFTVAPNVPEPLGPFSDPRIDYTIAVEPDGRNAVGNAHTFIVTLTDDTGTGVADQDIALTWSGAATDVTSVTPAGPDPDSLDCTTNGDGQCTVVVSSSDVGQETLSASWTTPYQNASGDGGVSTDGEAVASISAGAHKTWVGYVASIEETATNLVSNGDTAGEHPFTATVKEDDGSGSLTAADGVEVTVTWTGAPDDATITPSSLTCTTNASGQCSFTVDSPTSGAGTITIVELDGTILGLDDQSTDDDENLVDGSPTAEPGKSLTATKTWREYRARIGPDALNPVGQDHPFDVWVEYSEDGGATWSPAAIAGLTLDWDVDGGDPTPDEVLASDCDNGTDGDGTCTIVVQSSVAGSKTVKLLSVTGDLLPGGGPNATDLTYDFSDAQYDADQGEAREATKTWLLFGASIVSDGHNLVSTTSDPTLGEHTFTVTVWRQPAPGAAEAPVPPETKVTTIVSWDSDEPEPTNLVTDDDCAVNGTSNVSLLDGSLSSQCTITVNSTVPGTATVTVTGLDSYDFGGATGVVAPVVFAGDSQDEAVKTWYRYRAWIDADSTNLAGDPEGDHDFTVTVEQDSGAGWGPVPNDTTVTVTSPDGTNDGTLEDASCDTATSGGVSSCTIGVSSLAPGSRTVAVDQVQALAVDGAGNTWVDVSNGEYLEFSDPTQRTAATKTWVSYSATISADATNLTGQDHVFTVRAFVDSGDGPVPAPAGTTLTIDVDSDFLAAIADPNTCDGAGTGNQLDLGTTDPDDEAADHECFVVVSSDTVASVEVTVTHATPVSGTVDRNPTDDITDVEATKTWIEAGVTISADETNIAGESHTFLVDIHVRTPDGLVAAADLDGATVDIAVTGTTGSVDASSCDDSDGSTVGDGTVDGRCTVEVSSTGPGSLTVTATGVGFGLGGDDFVVDLTGTEGVASTQTLDDRRATKTWRVYRGSIGDDGLNLVRDEHPFSVLVEQSDDGTNWSPVATDAQQPTSVTVEHLSGTGGLVTGPGDDTLLGELSCQTAANGTCTVLVDSADAGKGTFRVKSVSLLHPDGSGPTTESLTSGVYLTDDQSVSANKTWAAFRASMSADSANITGDDHIFDVLVEYTTNGTDWTPVPDGSTVTYADSGTTGSVTGDTCAPTTLENEGDPDERVCTITVDTDLGDDAGTRTVTLTGVSAEVTVGALTEAFDVTFPDGVSDEPSGVLGGFDLGDYDATKTWASYTLQLDPATAVNLLSGQPGDTERYHTITATLGSDDATNAPVDGQTIDITIGGDTGVIDSVEDGTVETGGESATCVTDTDGTCDIVIFSGTPGQATVSGSYQATVGDSAPVTIEDDGDAVKTWTTFRVTVTPTNPINLVGNPHPFTVTIEQSKPAADCEDGDGDGWCPVVGAVPTVGVSGTGVTLDTTDCDGGTDAAGQCVVVVTSTTVQAATLTATYVESYTGYDTEITGSAGAVFSDTGDKSWIDYDIDVDPDTDENLVGTNHTFTVTVTTTVPEGEGGTMTMGVVGAMPDVFLSGPGNIISNTCAAGTVDDDPGTDADETGTCTVTITSGVPGLSTLDASYLGIAIGADPDDPSDDESRTYDTRETEEDDSGDKLWVDYRLTLGDDAVNAVGDPHTFTATLRRSEDGADDEDYLPAPGEVLTFTVDGVGSVTGGDVGDDLTCTTDVDGQCDIVINSDDAGATTVSVAHDAVVGATSRTDTDGAVKQWVDIQLVKTAVTGAGFSDGDLIADPDGFPFLAFTSSDRGPKAVVYEFVVTNPSNVTLEDVVLTDDRLGTIDLTQSPDCLTLAPGESCTARGSEQFDHDDATGALGAPITNIGTVTASGGGEDVSATDDATIGLVAVQSSILIDLVKQVVADAGDVTEVNGRPTVNWSQAEYEAGESKTVRYRFTVTNISNAPIVDVELVDPMISDEPIIAKVDGVTLEPGESTVVEVDHLLTVGEAFPDGPVATRVDNVASVSGANETRDSFSQATDDASVFTEIVFAEVLERKPLPVTGLGAGGLLPVAVLLIALGVAILWLPRRRAIGR